MTIMDRVNYCMLLLQAKLNEFIYDEDGDTNFISILVLLGIALALAGIFLSFQEEIMEWVNRNIGSFFSTDVKTRT